MLNVDGATVVRVAPGFGGYADHWFGPSEYVTRLAHYELRLRVTPNISYSFDLIIDGRSVSTGALVPPLARPPNDAFYRLGKFGASVAMVAMPYVFVISFVFSRFGPEWGPRWFAANELVFASGILPFMAGVGLYLINLVRAPSTLGSQLAARLFYGALGLGGLWIAVFGALELPTDIAEVIGTPETRRVTLVDSPVSTSEGAPSIRTADGATYQWVWAYGVYTYPRPGPGTYEIVLTPVRHRLVGIRAVP